MILITLDIDLYEQNVYILIGNSASKAVQYINKNFKDNDIELTDEGDLYKGFQWKTSFKSEEGESYRFFVFIKESELYSTTLEHEFIHLSWDILNYLNIKVSHKNHEALTYLFEYLVKKFNEEIGRAIIIKKKKIK